MEVIARRENIISENAQIERVAQIICSGLIILTLIEKKHQLPRSDMFNLNVVICASVIFCQRVTNYKLLDIVEKLADSVIV